jgi:branched-chain amino acid transport system ATP-binding protein
MPEDRRLIPALTVEENVLVPAWAAHVADAAARLEKVYGLIPELRELAPRRGLQLSGGQQKLVALGRALMCGTRLLLLDEPFEGVAPALAQRLVQVVAELKREGMSVFLSESDLQHSERMVDRIIVIDRGAITSRMRARGRLQFGRAVRAGMVRWLSGGFSAVDAGALAGKLASLIGMPRLALPYSFPASSR